MTRDEYLDNISRGSKIPRRAAILATAAVAAILGVEKGVPYIEEQGKKIIEEKIRSAITVKVTKFINEIDKLIKTEGGYIERLLKEFGISFEELVNIVIANFDSRVVAFTNTAKYLQQKTSAHNIDLKDNLTTNTRALVISAVFTASCIDAIPANLNQKTENSLRIRSLAISAFEGGVNSLISTSDQLKTSGILGGIENVFNEANRIENAFGAMAHILPQGFSGIQIDFTPEALLGQMAGILEKTMD